MHEGRLVRVEHRIIGLQQQLVRLEQNLAVFCCPCSHLLGKQVDFQGPWTLLHVAAPSKVVCCFSF